MRKFFSVVLSCLTCIGMLAYSALPVHAWNPETCDHSDGYFTSLIPVPTGFCIYDESGHHIEYGVEYMCPKCKYEFFEDTYFEFEKHGVDGATATIVLLDNGIAEIRYYCDTPGCSYYYTY